MLKQRLNVLADAKLQVGSAAILGTVVKLPLDRTWPIEEILICCDITAGGTPPSDFTAAGVLNLIKRIRLEVNDGRQPISAVDISGGGLLEYTAQEGLNLDPATLAVVAGQNLATETLIASNTYKIFYRIPLVHPLIQDPLRTRMLLAVNNHPQDPVLTLEFSTAAEMYATGTLGAVLVDFLLVRKQISPEVNKSILDNGGYIVSDLVETPYIHGTGETGEKRYQISQPGQYAGLQLRHFKGGAAVTRVDISETVTAGSETRWRLESGLSVIREWRNKHLMALNSYSRPLNHSSQVYSPAPGAQTTANQNFQNPASVFLDFIGDGISGNPINELGSLLDCNLPANSGLKMEIVGSIASVATNGSSLHIAGRRYFGDLSRWQALA